MFQIPPQYWSVVFLLCHGAGDYLLQSSWMALNKTQRWWPAIAHSIVYTICYLPLTTDWWRLAIIGGTHLIIDHYRLAGVWVRLVNNEWRKPQPVIPTAYIIIADQIIHGIINLLCLIA